jgi:hypothetical protein
MTYCRDPEQCIKGEKAAWAIKEIQMGAYEGIGQRVDEILREDVSEKIRSICAEIMHDIGYIEERAVSLHQYCDVCPEFWEF